jgi:hypothetical protein
VNTHLKISDSALESMCHSALETYLYGDGHETKSQVEVNGYLWGWRRVSDDEQMIFVDRVSPSFSSKKHQDWVRPNRKAVELQKEFMDRWAPEMSLLGDFHSHPYDDLNTVNTNRGYHFSKGDFNYLQNDEFIWQNTEYKPLIVVITICKLGRVHDTGSRMISSNVWCWDVGEFRFWLNAAVGYIKDGQRTITRNTHSNVDLDLNTRFFNFAGDRLQT